MISVTIKVVWLWDTLIGFYLCIRLWQFIIGQRTWTTWWLPTIECACSLLFSIGWYNKFFFNCFLFDWFSFFVELRPVKVNVEFHIRIFDWVNAWLFALSEWIEFRGNFCLRNMSSSFIIWFTNFKTLCCRITIKCAEIFRFIVRNILRRGSFFVLLLVIKFTCKLFLWLLFLFLWLAFPFG